MNNFYKKCAVIYDTNGKPLFVCDVLDFVNEEEYNKLKSNAQANFENLVNSKKKEDEEFKTAINKSIYDLAVAVKNYTNK